MSRAVTLPLSEDQPSDGAVGELAFDGCSPKARCGAAPRTLHVAVSDSSDDGWLHEICRAPRRSLQMSSSDESFLESLCRSAPSHMQSGRSLATEETQLRGPYTSQNQLVCDLVATQLHLPTPVWSLPSQNAIIRDALQAGGASPRVAGGASPPLLATCLWRIAAWKAALGICIFKVGIACDPVHRWFNREFGYAHERRWMFMDVMHVDTPEVCCRLETDLITALKPMAGCYNTRPGGEGISLHGGASTCGGASPPCHCYAVYAPAGSGVGVQAAWRLRSDANANARFPTEVSAKRCRLSS